MSFLDITTSDLIGTLLGFTFTIFVLSYIWGDNLFFRLSIHIFVGVAAGYATIVTVYNIILPYLIFPIVSGNRGEMILAVVYLIPSALVLCKISPRLSKLGNPAMAMLVGIGAAAAIGGAVIGTLQPQLSASINLPETHSLIDVANVIIILFGTLTTLIYFHFSTRSKAGQPSQRAQWIEVIGWIGQVFIAITFGSLFAGVYLASLTALIERFSFLWNFIKEFLLPLIVSA